MLTALSDRLMAKKIQPPFKPSVVSPSLSSNSSRSGIRKSNVSFPVSPDRQHRRLVRSPRPSSYTRSLTDVLIHTHSRNFDPEFTSENPQSSVITDSNLSQTVQQQFVGFTYNGNEEGAMGSVVPNQFTQQSP